MSNPDSSKPADSSDIRSHISERLCFFFSNANLRRDKFLQKIILDTSTQGFVPIATLLTFRTLQKWTSDAGQVVQTIKEDTACQSLLRLNESDTAVGRIQPFTQDMISSPDVVSCTIRIGNLPLVESLEPTTNFVQKQYDVTIEDIQNLFSEFGKVAMVQLIYDHHGPEKTKVAIGKAFVEFESVEGYNHAVRQLCDVDVKKTLLLGGKELTVKTMAQHLEKQKLKLLTRQKRGRKDDEGTGDQETPVTVDYTWQKECTIHLSGLSEKSERKNILQSIYDFWGETIVARVDHSFGKVEGYIRFEQPHEKILELVTALNEGLTLLDGAKVQARLLQEEEEEEYHKNFHDFLLKRMQAKVDEAKNKKHFRHNKKARGGWNKR